MLSKGIQDLNNQLQSHGQLEATYNDYVQYKQRKQNISRLNEEIALLATALTNQSNIEANQADLNAK